MTMWENYLEWLVHWKLGFTQRRRPHFHGKRPLYARND